MPAPSESLATLEQRLSDALLAFERLDDAWPKGTIAVERAETGRRREDALSEIVGLRQRIASFVLTFSAGSRRNPGNLGW